MPDDRLGGEMIHLKVVGWAVNDHHHYNKARFSNEDFPSLNIKNLSLKLISDEFASLRV